MLSSFSKMQRWILSTSIRTRILALTALSLVFIVLIAAIAFVKIRIVLAETEETSGNWLPSVQYVSAMFTDMIELRTKEYKYAALADMFDTPEKKARAEQDMDEALNRYKAHEKSYVGLISSEAEQRLYRQINNNLVEYLARNQEFRMLMRQGQVDSARAFLVGRGFPPVVALRGNFERLIAFNVIGGAQSSRNAKRALQDFSELLTVVLVCAVLVVLASGLLLSVQIMRPLQRLKSAAELVAQGDLNRLVELSSYDETGALTLSFNQMVRALRNATEFRALQYEQVASFNEALTGEIARREETERALADARDQADAANVAKSAFLANMSHEIRTPMNAVLGFTDLLKENLSDAKHQFYLGAISSSGKALLQIINDILDISKIEAGRLEIQLAPVHLHTLFIEVQDLMYIKAQEKGLEFVSTVDPTLPDWLLLDDVRLRQIILNLLSNAVKFSAEGTVRIDVKAIYKGSDRSSVDVAVEVSDNGIGIPADQCEAIFEPFRQQEGQQTKRYGGTGLGLTICKRLAQMMNGTLTVESTLGAGSTFRLVLREVAVSVAVPEEDLGVFQHVNIAFAPATVLVVDDVMYNRRLLTEFLASTELRLLEASDGAEALETIERERPALVLMDIKMDGMSGSEAVRSLRASTNADIAATPVIAVTASVMATDLERVRASGFNAVLHKPVSKPQLLREMLTFLPLRADMLDGVQSAMFSLMMTEMAGDDARLNSGVNSVDRSATGSATGFAADASNPAGARADAILLSQAINPHFLNLGELIHPHSMALSSSASPASSAPSELSASRTSSSGLNTSKKAILRLSQKMWNEAWEEAGNNGRDASRNEEMRVAENRRDTGANGANEAQGAMEGSANNVITSEQRQSYTLLLTELETERTNDWRLIGTSLKMSRIEEFALGLAELAITFQYQPLREYAALLLHQKQQYNLDALPTTLARFPAVVESLRELLREPLAT
jgi:signal transduction histidine kinase/ActR/RegA family two-component response regulator